jgi:signal transduction histidine kinase
VRSKSLSTRIITYSGTWVITALILSALLLVYFYRDHVAQHYDAHVDMHLEELVGASGFDRDGTFSLAFLPSDPRYDELHSGWYWDVRQSGESLKQSPSLGGFRLDLGTIHPTKNKVVYELFGPVGEPIRLHILQVNQGPNHKPLVYLASAPMEEYTDDVLNYSSHVISSFVLLGVGLLLIVVLQVRIALKPINAIGSEISDVREGKLYKLSQDYPSDVQPLVDELNNLLDHNVVLLKRARNQLGDLAHAVKNPLTVINNEARDMQPNRKDLILKQTKDINENINHYLSRARTFGAENVLGARSEVKKVVEDLVYTMRRLYQDQELEYDLSKLEERSFRGEGQDLEEMLGNLIDNACKWAKSHVAISSKLTDGRLLLVVEDDGPGIPVEDIGNVKRRGYKLDESKPGHGQGLGIVQDIAILYGGSLSLSASALGGLRAELNLPAV